MRVSGEVKKRKPKNHSELIESQSATWDRANHKRNKCVRLDQEKTKKRKKRHRGAREKT